MPTVLSMCHGGMRRSATFSLICGAFSTASPYVRSDIGAIEPGWWHSWHFCCRMGAMSLAYVTARCGFAAAGRGPYMASGTVSETIAATARLDVWIFMASLSL